TELSNKEYLIAEALRIQQELSIDDVRKILNQKTVYPLINRLLERKLLYLKEELQERYKPKVVQCVRLQKTYVDFPELLEEAFERLKRSDRQVETLMAYIQLSRKGQDIRKQDLYKAAHVDSTVIKAIVKKGIFELYEKQVSRFGSYEEEQTEAFELVDQQHRAIAQLKEELQKKQVALLHGVTGSGKTRVYIELIKEAIEKGEQVLYLLPEIALTAQIVGRLKKIFADQVMVYHSRLNNHERVELWQKVMAGQSIILGARSSLFLPFKHLSLIVVDEEHDQSFKQYDPAPRYHARDAAIYLAHQIGAKIILGTATPSIESFHHALRKKYALVEMPKRFGDIELPELILVDAREEMKKRTMQSHFTSVLLEELKKALERGEQAILFQNRRGYAPTLRCTTCGWHLECKNCDVSLTFHKFINKLRCHYCGYQSALPKSCPACGEYSLSLQGFGTEKIEDELKIYLPEAKIGRMDFDTVKGKYAHGRIINDFEEKRLDVLVGTQMVTKGLDFDNVSLVGVLSADHLLQFPDFRSSERAFQLITQVSGRAGRKHKRGKVIIQAFNIAHPVLKETLENDYRGFFKRELAERQDFQYPPFLRIIKISLKHRQAQTLNDASREFAKILREHFQHRVIGPAIPNIPRVRSYYLMDFMVKVEQDLRTLNRVKKLTGQLAKQLKLQKGFSALRINIDVDPY
ncbi:MAG: primosomal protein N', partial [Bacteroidota bacterium]